MLEDTRDESANIQMHINQLAERAKSLESQIQQESDTKQRAQLEVEQKEFKYVLDQQKQRYERLRERETRLNSELEGRLDALEREIENEMERQRSMNQEKSPKQ
jgi:hypothetical protein